MKLYVNYEEAQRRLDDSEPFVVRTLTAVHRVMLENANRILQPVCPFDMRYFYDAILRTIASEYDFELATDEAAHCRVSVRNPPDLSRPILKQSDFVQSGLARRFIHVVESESVADGCEFDLGFACEVAARSLDSATLNAIVDGIGKKGNRNDTYETWLEGFTAAVGERKGTA